jgi:DNA-binding GntR family transcriptional regulator
MTATEPASGPDTTGRTLSHQIREALVQRIVSGELEPGERLVETRLAAVFGTSQAPVREALRELASIGMVEMRPRRGTFVRHFVQQTLKESYVVRAALEEAATRLSMLRGSVATAALRQDVAAMTRAAEEDDARAVARASVSFHRHVVESAGNDLLLRSWEALEIAARTEVTVLAVDLDLHDVAADHDALLEVMIGGDVEAACRHAREHQWVFAELPHGAARDA